MLYDETYYVDHFDPNTNENLGNYSSFCDDKTWYSFDGYVTRVVGGSAFYIQTKSEITTTVYMSSHLEHMNLSK